MSTRDNLSPDTVSRFLFNDCDVRGEMITLDQTALNATQHQALPDSAKALLSEFLSAAGLLAGILKFEGVLTIQVRGDGDVPLIMAEATHDRNLRGIVKVNEGVDISDKPLRELTGNGVLTLTIDPEKGQRYQGVVALEGDTIADCLTAYFTQSEQLPTRLWLFSDGQKAGGFFLQGLPADVQEEQQRADTWQTLTTLADTLTADESLNLDHSVQLTRLFHEYTVRLTGEVKTQFACSCSQERSEGAIAAIGKEEAYGLLDQQPEIAIDCQFCGQGYTLDKSDLDRIFNTTMH